MTKSNREIYKVEYDIIEEIYKYRMKNAKDNTEEYQKIRLNFMFIQNDYIIYKQNRWSEEWGMFIQPTFDEVEYLLSLKYDDEYHHYGILRFIDAPYNNMGQIHDEGILPVFYWSEVYDGIENIAEFEKMDKNEIPLITRRSTVEEYEEKQEAFRKRYEKEEQEWNKREQEEKEAKQKREKIEEAKKRALEILSKEDAEILFNRK